MGRTNRHHTPYWGVAICLALSTAVVVGSSARDQDLVLFYAVAVFLSFFIGLVAMARFNRADGKRLWLTLNVLGASVVGFTLMVNLTRGFPIVSLLAALAVAGGLYALWVRAGRPRGVSNAVALAGQEDG